MLYLVPETRNETTRSRWEFYEMSFFKLHSWSFLQILSDQWRGESYFILFDIINNYYLSKYVSFFVSKRNFCRMVIFFQSFFLQNTYVLICPILWTHASHEAQKPLGCSSWISQYSLANQANERTCKTKRNEEESAAATETTIPEWARSASRSGIARAVGMTCLLWRPACGRWEIDLHSTFFIITVKQDRN